MYRIETFAASGIQSSIEVLLQLFLIFWPRRLVNKRAFHLGSMCQMTGLCGIQSKFYNEKLEDFQGTHGCVISK